MCSSLRRRERDDHVLQQIFIECDASVSTSTPDSTGDAVPISRIVEYVQDQLPSSSIDNLVELWKCLVAVLTNDRVNFHQFKEATRRWIVKVQQSAQNGSNKAREKLYLVSDADSSMKTMDVDKELDAMELELREKFRELYKENIVLHDELERHEASIGSLKQQHSITEKQLKHYIQKCQQLETENDEQRDQLNELIKKEKTVALALQKYTKEHQNLLKQLEAAEIEVQAVPSLKEKLEKIIKEKMDYIRSINKMQKEFDEKEDNCKQLKTTIIQLEETNISMKESYEYTIRNLRERNRLLTDENVELQTTFTICPVSGERLSISPIPDTDGCCAHSTPYKSQEVLVEDSLYMELKASGFTAECSRNDRQDLEEILNEYDAAICAIVEQLEKVIQFFVKMRGSTDDLAHPNSQDTDARAHNINVLKHKTALLLNMAEETTKRDSSTQLRADPANVTSSLDQFGVKSFQDLLHARRSIHTLPSTLQSLQSSSLTAEDSRCRTFGCQIPGTNIIGAPFAQGDGLTQEDEESTPLAAEMRDVSDQEDSARSEENQSCKMLKESSVLQVNSTTTSETEDEKTSVRSFQVSEVSSASDPTNPRRKISVYCRSFDVVTVQDRPEDHPGSNLEVRRSPSNPDDSPAQVDRIAARDRNSTPGAKYPFNVHVYRNAKSDSDSSNSTPRKFQDSLLDDEPSAEEPIFRKVRLAPTRLKFPQETGDNSDRTAEAPNCASAVPLNSTELDISDCPLSAIGEYKEDDDASVHSSSTFIDKCKMEVKSAAFESESCLNENVSQAYSMQNRLLPRDRANSAKIVDSENPHSQTSVRRVDSESQTPIEWSVDSQMSSREDSLAVSGDEREPATKSDNRCGVDENVANEVGKTVNVVTSTSLVDPVSTKVTSCKNVVLSAEKTRERRSNSNMKQEIRQWLLKTKRSYSEGENLGQLKFSCRCDLKNASSPPASCQRTVFPSLTDIRLQESGIANLSEESKENLSELELQKKCTAFSLCLSTDRLTLPLRITLSRRQRDQSERNLSYEVQKMQQDIQELAPLCTDRESVERVERVRHQLDMIVRCAHRVSCAAETLGAVHQERRISQAVLLTDKYLHVLQSRCEKLIANVAETKRILVENNIVIEENSGENDELPRRYRSGTPANNRMMMARRRASVATMSRPMGNAQDVTKEIARQRNSVSGRMILRRPSFSSFSSESPKWEIEKLDRTESSNSISELRGIFEQAESRRSSKEENNNMLRSNHSNSQNTINCAIIDEFWTNVKEETSPEISDNESINSDSKSSTRSSYSFHLKKRKLKRRRLSIWHIILPSFFIFCLVFYMIQAMSPVNTCYEPLQERLIRYIFNKYPQIRNAGPHPM